MFTWIYITTLHKTDPNIHVLVTSQMTEGGAQNSMTSISAIAKLTINMLVTDCIDFVVVTAIRTCKTLNGNYASNSLCAKN